MSIRHHLIIVGSDIIEIAINQVKFRIFRSPGGGRALDGGVQILVG